MSQPEIQVLNDFMSWFVIQQTIMADDPLQCKDILEYLNYLLLALFATTNYQTIQFMEAYYTQNTQN